MVDHRSPPVIVLWREVKRRVGRLHVARHRDMLMRDPPRALHLPKTHSHAHPGFAGLASDPRALDSIQAVTERNIFARRDAQVTCLILNRALHRSKPGLEVLSIGVYPLIVERG